MRVATPVFVAFMALWPVGASAGPRAAAEQLGELIGSETACALTFDKNAVRAFIEKNVSADDLEFAGRLKLYTSVRGTPPRKWEAPSWPRTAFRSSEAPKPSDFWRNKALRGVADRARKEDDHA